MWKVTIKTYLILIFNRIDTNEMLYEYFNMEFSEK